MAMERENRAPRGNSRKRRKVCQFCVCLLYTSDAADD